MKTMTLHKYGDHHRGLRVSLGILGVLLVFLFAIAFQLFQSRQMHYTPYDAQEIEAK